MGGALAGDAISQDRFPVFHPCRLGNSSTHERQVTRRIADHRDRERRTANFIISSRPRFSARISSRSQENRETFRSDNEIYI